MEAQTFASTLDSPGPQSVEVKLYTKMDRRNCACGVNHDANSGTDWSLLRLATAPSVLLHRALPFRLIAGVT